MSHELTTLERMALDVALSGRVSWKEQLRQQLPHLRVLDREYTGYGFYTKFACEGCSGATELPPAGTPESSPVAWAVHPDVEGGISFSLYLKDGIIDCLEAASSTSWPDTEEKIRFSS